MSLLGVGGSVLWLLLLSRGGVQALLRSMDREVVPSISSLLISLLKDKVYLQNGLSSKLTPGEVHRSCGAWRECSGGAAVPGQWDLRCPGEGVTLDLGTAVILDSMFYISEICSPVPSQICFPAGNGLCKQHIRGCSMFPCSCNSLIL